MITIIDYGAGNSTSVANALRRIDCPCEVTSDPERIVRADKIIFPGVGAAGQAMAQLATTGIGEALLEAIARGVSTLGICLGMQILFDWSAEDGGVDCLGVIPGKVVKFASATTIERLKVPHIGWNRVKLKDKNFKLKIKTSTIL